jgi:hypothetical protein
VKPTARKSSKASSKKSAISFLAKKSAKLSELSRAAVDKLYTKQMINESIAPFTIDIIYSKKILFYVHCTDKKENEIFLTYKEIQMGSVAKSYMRKGFRICEKIRKYLTIYSMRRPLVIYDFVTDPF